MESSEITYEWAMQQVAIGKQYTLVFLKAGKTEDEKDLTQMQKDHLVFLFKLQNEGKISVFGPLLNNEQLRGVMVFNTSDKETVLKEMNQDPYIREGYLRVELHEWFSIPGQTLAE